MAVTLKLKRSISYFLSENPCNKTALGYEFVALLLGFCDEGITGFLGCQFLDGVALVEMYVLDERFKAYYDDRVEGCAQWLRDAVKAWLESC